MIKFLNKKVRHLSVIDIGLTKFAVFFATLIIVKLWPELLTIDFTILISLVILCAAKPFYFFWFRSKPEGGV